MRSKKKYTRQDVLAAKRTIDCYRQMAASRQSKVDFEVASWAMAEQVEQMAKDCYPGRSEIIYGVDSDA